MTQLASRLNIALPHHLEVLVAPFDVDIGRHSQVQPDIAVVPRDDDAPYPAPPPLLAVEVLSPFNRGYDLLTKRNLDERAGVASCWVVDPDEPAVIVLELDDGGRYVEIERVTGTGVVSVRRPCELAVTPAELVR